MNSLESLASEVFDPTAMLSSTRFRLTPNARSEAADRRRLEQDLRQALSLNHLVLHYQPRIALVDGARVGAEALIRWPHRKRGMLLPAAFLPMAERSTLISRIGGWVTRTACTEAANWPDRGVVSVNVSPRQLADGALLDQVAEALEISGLPPDRLELELTESTLLDLNVEVLLTLSAIRDLGVGLALDDFGTGYASLGMLKRLPLTTIKLDRSLIRTVPGDRDEVAIVRAGLETGHALGLVVVAEGVETEEQMAFLTAMGCDEAQGYLFNHPLPASQLFGSVGNDGH